MGPHESVDLLSAQLAPFTSEGPGRHGPFCLSLIPNQQAVGQSLG